MKDSIMMNSLFMAMNNAHEKLKSRQGVIGRLIEISKFYELAVMQLDGCLKIVEEETDSFSLEVNHEEMVSDLYMIRDRLQRRLDDTELTIMNTDSCLAERFENELKLREALEMKEKELVSLQGDLDQLERTKSEGHQVLSKSLKNQVSGVDDGKEGDISQLKNSVDMKFCSFKQMFEERKFSVESSQIDQLSSDIDRLKESLDLAFGKMQNAIFLSAVEPAEHEWRWSIEKDVMLISAKGLTDDFHDIHEPTVWKLNYFSLLMNEIRSLRSEFEQLMRENETKLSPSPSIADFRVKLPSGTKERPPLDDKKDKNYDLAKPEQADHIEEEGGNYVAKLISTHERIIQNKIEEQRAKEKLIKERWYSAMRKDRQPDGLNKKIQDVITRLDSIINMNPPSKIPGEVHKDIVKPKPLRRFASESELELRDVSPPSMFCQVDDDVIGQIRIIEQQSEESGIQSFILEEVHTIILRDCVKQCYDDFEMKIEKLVTTVRMLKKETENYKAKSTLLEEECKTIKMENEDIFQKINILELENKDKDKISTILEEVYTVLLKSLATEHHDELDKMSASKDLLEEIVDEFMEDAIATIVELQTVAAIFSEKMKDTNNADFSLLADLKGILMNSFGGKIKQKIFFVLFKGLVHELGNYIENFNTGNLVREEADRVVFGETIWDAADSHTSKQSKLHDLGNSKESSSTNTLDNLKETNAFQEMVEEWKMNLTIEHLITEDIYLFIVKEAAKDANILSRTSKDSLSGKNLFKSCENGKDNFIQRLDLMLQCMESALELGSTEIAEIMEQNSSLDQKSSQYLEHLGIQMYGSAEDILVDGEINCSTARRKFEDALHQLHKTRNLIAELRFGSGVSIDHAVHDEPTVSGDEEHTLSCEDDVISFVTADNLYRNKKLVTDINPKAGIDIDQAPTTLDSISYYKDSVPVPNEPNSGAELTRPLEPLVLVAVSEVLNKFEQTVHAKLDSSSLRLEATKHHLTSLSQHMGSLRKNEVLYKNAFIRRCHDLHLAETEVDLLGDQVDSLLTLLERIYWTLYRHSPALRQFLEVQELMNLIKKETNCGTIINLSIAS